MKINSKSRTRIINACTWVIPIVVASLNIYCKSMAFTIYSEYGSISRQICNDRFDDIDKFIYGKDMKKTSERYYAIVHPLSAMKINSKSRTRIINACTWVIPIVVASLNIYCKSMAFTIYSEYGSISRQICNDRFDDIDKFIYGKDMKKTSERSWLQRMTRPKRYAICVCVAYVVFLITYRVLFGNVFNRLLPNALTTQHQNVFPSLMTSSPKAARLVYDVNCASIFANDRREISKAVNISSSKSFHRKAIRDEDYIQLTSNCDKFAMQRGYNNYIVTPEEKDFPIAFSILLYKEVEQAERLLRAIYRPQNIYCIHVDADSAPVVHEAIDAIANCFSNVFVVSKKEYVVYAGYTRLQADINCMENLLERGKTWKYFLNLPSQEFPIKTNEQIVKILKVYNGANDIQGMVGGPRNEERLIWRYLYKHKNGSKSRIFRTKQTNSDLPYNITLVKGSAYGVLSRGLVEYICSNKIARVLLDYMRDIYCPDEYYWSTLNHNPHIGAPGAYRGPHVKKPYMSVYVNWGSSKCEGMSVRDVCVFGVGDLSKLVTRNEMFVNKLYVNFQSLAYDCMEEWYFNMTTGDSSVPKSFNLTYYQSLPFIRK